MGVRIISLHVSYLRNSTSSKYSLQYRQTSSHDHIVADILHDLRCFTGDQSEEYWCLVEVPEEEQFSAAGRCASYMTEEIHWGVPESLVKAQDNLWTKQICFRHFRNSMWSESLVTKHMTTYKQVGSKIFCVLNFWEIQCCLRDLRLEIKNLTAHNFVWQECFFFHYYLATSTTS